MDCRRWHWSVLVIALGLISSMGCSENPRIGETSFGVDTAPLPLPPATLSVWNTQPTLGNDPDESVADLAGVTVHAAAPGFPLTIVTAYENTFCSGLPCGVTFWNPATNYFKCYGFSAGTTVSIDVDLTNGDTWISGSIAGGIRRNFAGTNNFRQYNITDGWGAQVNQATHDLAIVDVTPSGVSMLTPAGGRMRWPFSGEAHYVVIDGSGRMYVTVRDGGPGGIDQLVRVDPATNEMKKWDIPGVSSFGFYAFTNNGLTIDNDGNVWFAQSLGNQIGRLSGGANGVIGDVDDEICEFAKPGLANPQLLASDGSDAPPVFAGKNLQTYFTEDSPGNAISILTQKEALGGASGVDVLFPCAIVAPATSVVPPELTTVPTADAVHLPTEVVIPPVVSVIPGVDGLPDAVGHTRTFGPDGIDDSPLAGDDERIPGILRYPVAPGNTGASGMTQVAAPNTIYGTFQGTDRLWGLHSLAIVPTPTADCNANGPYTVECSGGVGTVALDGTGSGGIGLTYSWSTTCPGGVFDDATSATPDLTVDGPPPCPVECTVALTVTDTFGNTDTCSSDVTITDTTPPALVVPPPLEVECSAPGGVPAAHPAIQAWLALAACADGCGACAVANDAPAFFPAGCDPGVTTPVSFTATDGCGNQTVGASSVTVVDSQGPVIDVQPSLSATGCAFLWPPEHGYVDFALGGTGIAAHDVCDDVSFEFSACASSQPEDADDSPADGDGSSTRDCVMSGDGQTVSMRAERSGVCGPLDRVYTTAIGASDNCDNVTPSDPFGICGYHDRGHQPPATGPIYSANPESNQNDTRAGTSGTYGADCGPGCSLACDPTQSLP